MSRRTSPRTSEEAEMGTATHRVVGSLAATAKLSYVPQDHEPVLAEELVDLLDPRPGETFLDCTFGGGGHARLIAERLGPEGELIAVDRDPAAEERWRDFSAEVPSGARFLRADFAAALEGLRGEGVRPDGIVFDLGMSSRSESSARSGAPARSRARSSGGARSRRPRSWSRRSRRRSRRRSASDA